jgi:hypothetical protein
MEGWVLPQNSPLKISELRAGLEACLVDQPATGRSEAVERVLLTSAPIEREHELTNGPLPVRILRDERLEIGHDRRGVPKREPRVEPVLEGGHPELLEPPQVAAVPYDLVELGERSPPPHGERVMKKALRLSDVATSETFVPFTHEPLESQHIDCFAGRVQTVPVLRRVDRVGAETTTDTADVVSDHLASGRRRPLAPKRLNDRIA